jgi:hypothetical protein
MTTATQTRRAHSDTSSAAFLELGNTGRQNMQSNIVDICIAAHRNGIVSLTAAEIGDRYFAAYHKHVKEGSVAGRVSELVAAKRLEAVDRRVCLSATSDHKSLNRAVRVPATQARLVY